MDIYDFIRAARQNPQKTALAMGNTRLSFAETLARASAFAAALVEERVEPGDVAPIVLPRGVEAVCAMLGVLLAGAAFCAVDEAYPEARKRFIADDIAAKLTITPEWIAERVTKGALFAPVRAEEGDPALVVYTSGSTGVPKGVTIPYGAFYLALEGDALSRTRDDVFLSTASFSFVAVVLDVLTPLFMGATVHIASDETRRDAELMAAFIRERGVSTAFMPPQMAKVFIERWDGLLRVLITGSDRVRRLYGKKTRVYNVYGASETCGPCVSFEIDRDWADDTPIGAPYPGSGVVLLDEAGHPTSRGEVGEICVWGQIALGYRNMPELTGERFAANPLAAGDDDGLIYKTGDLGRLDDEGRLHYVQRKDWMIKTRGYRIEPGEIECAIVKYAGAAQALVNGYENARGQTLLCAVYTASSPLPPAEVKAAIAEFLPGYMIPFIMEQVPRLPLNANGKLDRSAVKPSELAARRADYAPPTTAREAEICRAFEGALGVETVGIDDDFTLLGGDSISAVSVQALLGGSLSAHDIVTEGTPRLLAAERATPITAGEARTSWPLTDAERQMAIEQSMNPESVAYNVNLAFAIEGELDVARLERALAALSDRHQALRSYYEREGEQFAHKVLARCAIPLERKTCAFSELDALIARGNAPFALERAPLARYALIDTEKGRVLHLCFHHIIIDGASGAIFMDELWKLYDGEALDAPSLKYTDYALWEERNRDYGPGEAFFAELFADGVPQNDMPTVPVRPEKLPIADTDVEREMALPPISAAAKARGVSVFALLMAATGLTLAKYCASEDVVLGAAMSGRSRTEQEKLFGMLVNTAPVRLKPRADMAVSEYLRETAGAIRAAKAHQDYPFSELVSRFATERTSSRAPIFDVMVNYLTDWYDHSPSGLSVRELPIKRQAMAIDLQLEFLQSGDTLRAVLSYSPALYYPQVAENFLLQLESVIGELARGEAATLREASKLPPAQRARILGFRGERAVYRDKTVLDGFMRQAQATPDYAAVEFCGRTLTYAELDDITDRLAARLKGAFGVGRGDRVGVMIRRCELIPICAIGVIKTGALYMPLDASYPPDRLRFMLADSAAKALIADEGMEDIYRGFAGAVLPARGIEALPPAGKPTDLPTPDDLMVLLYTSGTTGAPKGVSLYHRGVYNICAWYAEKMKIAAGENTAAYASFGFDAHMCDMFPPLMEGACVHIVPEEMRLDLPAMYAYFSREKINALFMTTQMGRQFVDGMAESGLDFSALHSIAVGGEALAPILPPKELDMWNLYGPSECSLACTGFLVDKLYDRIPIGSATANTALYVLDARGDIAPVGVQGELYVAGRQVGAGYLNRPELTGERFIANPFADEPEYATMYKTGDVVRFLPDGSVDFVGRRDFQVKIRGFRVELTEIEARIREYPGMRDVTVQAVSDASGGKRVVAYFVASRTVDVKELVKFIVEALPSYMAPSAMMQLERIPLTPNGKVNRRALPEIELRADDITPPRTPLEERLVDIMSDMLGMKVGINTDLMYAGLSSLSAIKAAARITNATGREIATRQVMSEKTIENIARLIEGASEVREKTYEKRDVYPLSPNQMGLYYAWVKNPAALEYNIAFSLELNADADAQRLADCAAAVVEAHPYVKARLRLVDNAPCQLRRDDAPFSVPVARCSEARLGEIKAGFVRPFELIDGDLLRMRVCQTPLRTCLLCDVHHIVFDGASADIFMADLSRAWAGERLERETFTSFELALREAEVDREGTRERDREFFASLIGDCEGATTLSGGTPTGAIRRESARVGRASVDPVLKGLGVTRANWFLSAASLVISRLAGAPRARIVSIINGREGRDRQNIFGMLVKTLPTIIDVPGEARARDYCLAAQERMNAIIDHSSFAYMDASAAFRYDAQIFYAYQGGVIERHALAGQEINMEELSRDALKFPISIRVYEEPGDYRVEVEYDEGQFGFMREFADSVAHMARQLAMAPEAALNALSILTPEQKATLDGFARPIRPSGTQALHHMFEEQALRNHDKLALVASDGRFTFAQLNQKANRLAHALLERGVESEDRVAFMLPRTSDVLVAMLGIMKAGCCYIPVDPEYPRQRVEHVLGDSAARYIITTKDMAKLYDNALTPDTLSADDSNPNVAVRRERLCYMIYTSGSTGKPKGVMITHGGIINYVTNAPENRHVRALVENDCVFCSVTTVSFDMFLKEAFTTLMNGLTLVFADEEAAHNPDLLARLMKETGATAFNATPSRMLKYLELPAIQAALSRCKVIMAGGEKYPPALYKRLRACGEATLINTYGPTEITVSSNAKLLTDENVTIGAPLFNVVEQVMDFTGNPLPAGMVGELYIGGEGVARGYFGNSKMTAERFIERDGVRYYKSGDLARWTKDGEIALLGRNDGQIKLRGLRIELGEIENALLALPGVKECAVTVREIRAQEHLCAYYTARAPLSADEVREKLAKTLTKYMVPTAYLQMEALPQTPNGKTDVRALPPAQLFQMAEYVAPANEREEDFCRVMADILKLDRVGVTDSFFDLGGHSLLVTQLTIDAAKKGYSVSYGDVFANPTPRALAAVKNEPQNERRDEAKYDYTEIDKLLSDNTIEAYRRGERRPIGNLCLTGATGFLGAHVLKAYLEAEKGCAYCLVRGKNGEKRLKNVLFYYFSDSMDALFGSRVVVVPGDVTDADSYGRLDALPIDTFVNCAANVKHFSQGTDIWDINVKGCENGIAFALRKGCRFVQISTTSVAGMNVDGALPDDAALDETKLYFGQDTSNQYVGSKFEAERLVLEACARGLDGKIMRVGNLMARHSDGEFQMNFNTNSFLGKIKAYAIIGKISYAQLGQAIEFAPIDMTAEAILRLAATPRECRVFHPYNDHYVFMSDVVDQLNALGVVCAPCEEEEYQEAYGAALADPDKVKELRALIAYKDMAHSKSLRAVRAVNAYTSQILLREGFHWPITSREYLDNFLRAMRGLGVFD